MAETKSYTLKSFFSPALVKRLAADLRRAHARFPEAGFVRDACAGLAKLELMDRGRHIARALATHLPAAYPEAIEVLLASLAPEDAALPGGAMSPFFYYPHTVYVAEHGLAHFELSMRAQLALTKRFTAEWSMRPFLAREPERTFTFLHRSARDPHANVRRMVSECTRLRLPWGARVAWLDENPERVLELLELLKDDPSEYVRRSVANNLNDLGKSRPELLQRTCASWLEGATDERRALVEHALRSAVKRGDPAALRLLGYGAKAAVELDQVSFAPPRVKIGEKVDMRFVLRSRAGKPQDLLVDVAVHFVKARGQAAPKVFKVKRVVLPARGSIELGARFSLKVHTTRKPNPGVHRVDVLVNGEARPAGSFRVV